MLAQLFCRHKMRETVTRRIEISNKKNKPPEQYIEAIQTCTNCAMETGRAYLKTVGDNVIDGTGNKIASTNSPNLRLR